MINLPVQNRTVKLDIPPSDHIAKIIDETHKWYEQAMLDDIKNRAPKGVALDVGACFGTHSVWFNTACGMKVIAFEPNDVAADYLQRNITNNSLDDGISVVHAAVGNRKGFVTPLEPTVGGNLGSTKMKLQPRNATDGTPMITIDSLELNNVGLIKIDVEGMELKVLQGAEKTIRRCRPLIYVESNDPRQLTRQMGWLGYKQFDVFNKTPTYGYEPLKETIDVVPATTPLKLSAVIMAHPKRERFMPYLQQRLGNVPIVWDQINNRWDTGRRSMLAFDPDATHHIVVQDDALLCKDFLAGVRQAIKAVPDNPISFYIGKVRPNHLYVQHMVEKAEFNQSTWIAMDGPWWGVAIVIPTKYIPEMIEWCDTQVNIPNYDKRMSRYFLRKKIDCFYSVPSLVSHRVGMDNPSLVPGRGNGAGRVSYHFIGENESALSVEWTSKAVVPGVGTPPKTTP